MHMLRYVVFSIGHTKLMPWSSDFVFENKERASENFIFVQQNSSIRLWSERMIFILLQSKSLEVRTIYFFHSQNIHRLTI